MNDINSAKKALAKMPVDWDGKKSILELKKVDYNWRQMEWWAFYFEYHCRNILAKSFTIPGDKIGTVTFDAKRDFNWDFKAKAIKSDDHRAILNDQNAMDFSIHQYKRHGVMIGLCDVEYNDKTRSFQKWHTKLKGGLSEYEVERKTRTSVSRYRKTHARLQEILFLEINERNVNLLDVMRQGRNSNGKPRPPKYMLDLEKIDSFLVGQLKFR